MGITITVFHTFGNIYVVRIWLKKWVIKGARVARNCFMNFKEMLSCPFALDFPLRYYYVFGVNITEWERLIIIRENSDTCENVDMRKWSYHFVRIKWNWRMIFRGFNNWFVKLKTSGQEGPQGGVFFLLYNTTRVKRNRIHL